MEKKTIKTITLISFVFLMCVFILIYVLPHISVTTIYDLSLDNESEIYAGHYEACITPYSEINCEEGLECRLTSTEPHRNGICLKPGERLQEDLINRPNDFDIE